MQPPATAVSASPAPSGQKVPHLLASVLLVICVTRLGTSLYLPALPAMRAALNVSVDALNSTLTLFFIAFAASTLVAGQIADSLGRRWSIRNGMIIFILGSLLCGFAEALPQIWVGRLVQAIGVAFVPVGARALVRDACDPRRMLSTLGWISMIASVGPVLATVLGGFIVQHAGWQATFHVLSIGGAAVLLLVWRRLPETLSQPQPLRLGTALHGYGEMLASGSFTLVVLPMAFCFMLQGVYFACAPYIFVSIFKMSPSAFGLCNLAPLGGLLCGRPLSIYLAKRYSPFTAYLTGGILTVTAGVTMPLLLITHTIHPVTFLLATSLYSLGFGALTPVGMQAVLTAWKAQAGKASALFGFSTFGAMAVGSGMVSLFVQHPEQMLSVMAWLTLGYGVAVFVSTLPTRKYFSSTSGAGAES